MKHRVEEILKTARARGQFDAIVTWAHANPTVSILRHLRNLEGYLPRRDKALTQTEWQTFAAEVRAAFVAGGVG